MNAAAERVLVELPDVVVAYGISDEYRYAFSIYGSWLGSVLD